MPVGPVHDWWPGSHMGGLVTVAHGSGEASAAARDAGANAVRPSSGPSCSRERQVSRIRCDCPGFPLAMVTQAGADS